MCHSWKCLFMSYNPLRYTCNVQIFSTNIWKEAVQLKSLELHFQNVLKFLAAYNSATTITSGPSFIVTFLQTHTQSNKRSKKQCELILKVKFVMTTSVLFIMASYRLVCAHLWAISGADCRDNREFSSVLVPLCSNSLVSSCCAAATTH